MSDTTFYAGTFEVVSRSNPDYQPVALDVTQDVFEDEHCRAAELRVTDTNQPGTTLRALLGVRNLTILADALEKMQETARFTSPNLMRLTVKITMEHKDGNHPNKDTPMEILEVSYVANAARFVLTNRVPEAPEKSYAPSRWNEQTAEAWLSAGETTAFIANARLFAVMLENNKLV